MKNKIVILSIILAILTASSMIVLNSASGDTENSWIQKAAMHVARGGLGVAAMNGKVYAIGGSTQTGWQPSMSGFVSTNEEYNPATDTWIYKAVMPTARAGFAIAVHDNKVYCIGGIAGYSQQGGYAVIGTNEVYDPTTNTWATKAPMPNASGWITANIVNGKIYVTGGIPNGTLTQVYDPAIDTWTTKASSPVEVSSYSSAIFDNKIYIIGGWSLVPPNWGFSYLNHRYDPATDSWSAGISAPSTVYAGATGVTSGEMAPRRIYVLGVSGDNGIGYPAVLNQIYDPTSDRWANGAGISATRLSFGVAVVDDLLYVIGGHTHNEIGYTEPVASNVQYTPFGYGTPDPSYQPPAPSPSASPSPTSSQSPTPTPTPTASPSPQTPSPSASPSPTASELQPASSPDSEQASLQTNVVYVAVAAAAIGAVAAVAVLARRKRR